jgi:hypothetical protein
VRLSGCNVNAAAGFLIDGVLSAGDQFGQLFYQVDGLCI